MKPVILVVLLLFSVLFPPSTALPGLLPYDGYGNHRGEEGRGASGAQVIHVLEPAFADGRGSPRSSPANPRAVSFSVFTIRDDLYDHREMSDLHVFFGQVSSLV